MKTRIFSRVDRQVSILLAVMLLLSSIFIYFASINIYYDSILTGLANRVENIHTYIEHQLTPDTFLTINSKEDMALESYQNLKAQMNEVRDIGDLRYLYTAKQNDAGQLIYVVDGLPEDADDFRYPGDLIEPEIQSELKKALSGEIVLPDEILDTDWGHIFIAYYPLRINDTVIGALGIELSADTEIAALRNLSKVVFLTCGTFCVIAYAASVIIFRRISNPLYRDMANTDFMTQLKNRNSFETDRQNLIARKKTDNLTVAIVDVNNLKLVNDRLGHETGDNCIVKAAKLLQSIESDKITAYRYGGDEFIVLMKDTDNPGALLASVKEKFQKYGDKINAPISLAIGYAHFDKTLDTDIMDTQRRADEQMYHDKTKIKNQNNSEDFT